MIWDSRSQKKVTLRTPCGQDLGPARSYMVELEGNAKTSLETGRTRLIVAGAVFALAFLAIGLRLVDLALFSITSEPRLVARQGPVGAEDANRAAIVDRNGELLAMTVPKSSLYANPSQMRNPSEAAQLLASLLPHHSRASLEAKFRSDREFLWVERRLSPQQADAINRLGIPGLYFRREDSRVYPHGGLASHVIGFTNIDGRGLAGVELALDEALIGNDRPLELSLDVRLQHILAEELQAGMQEFHGVGAAGLVMDAESGEILALVSLPTYDPNEPGTASQEARFNRVTHGLYELGSIFKIFTTAMALDSGLVDLNDGYDTTDPIRVGGFTIRDFKPKNRWLSVPEIFVYSSNIGTVHLVREVGAITQQHFLDDLGLLRSASVELPEVGQPLVPSPWREISSYTISYGHGLSVTPLQAARAGGAIINGGRLPPGRCSSVLPGSS